MVRPSIRIGLGIIAALAVGALIVGLVLSGGDDANSAGGPGGTMLDLREASIGDGRLPLPPNTNYALAPIDGLEVIEHDGNPRPYQLRIDAGLPSGCAQAAGYKMERSGDLIRVEVFNSMPSGNVPCTLIYGMYETTLNLGANFDAGKTYRVQVNDKTTSFTAR
jgi:hypothetical protein